MKGAYGSKASNRGMNRYLTWLSKIIFLVIVILAGMMCFASADENIRAITLEAENITETSAVLIGQVNKNGGSDYLGYNFFVKEADEDAYWELEWTSGHINSNEDCEYEITGLKPGTEYEYYFYAVSENTSIGDNGALYGLPVIFETEAEDCYLSVDKGHKNGLDARYEGGKGATINVSSNTEWWLDIDEDWIDVDEDEGEGNGSFTVYIDENDGEERTGYIYVEADDCSTIKIKVVQEAAPEEDPYLSVDKGHKNGLEARYGGGQGETINVSSNTEWWLDIDEDWIDVDEDEGEGNGRFTVYIDENDGEERTGYIYVEADDCDTIKIKVVQEEAPEEEPYLSVDKGHKNGLEARYGGGQGETIKETKQRPKMSEDEWNSSSLQCRLDYLKDVLDFALADMGVERRAMLIACRIDPVNDHEVYGKYSNTDEEVVIDMNHLKRGIYSCLNTVLHEARHIFQYDIVERLDWENSLVFTSDYYRDVREWRTEFMTPYEADVEYRYQSCEEDAREYADEHDWMYVKIE